MEPGKPDAGKPPVRFDEGREADGHWLTGLSIRRFPPTLHPNGAYSNQKIMSLGILYTGFFVCADPDREINLLFCDCGSLILQRSSSTELTDGGEKRLFAGAEFSSISRYAVSKAYKKR